MNANELMIGDWVLSFTCKGEAEDPKPRRIEGIGESVVLLRPRADMGTNPYGYNAIQPVPLTPEILEKNGFQKKKISDYKSLFCIVSQNYNCLFLRWIGIPEFDIGSSFDEDDELQEFATIRYVHELQHALRLCGIEKTIIV